MKTVEHDNAARTAFAEGCAGGARAPCRLRHRLGRRRRCAASRPISGARLSVASDRSAPRGRGQGEDFRRDGPPPGRARAVAAPDRAHGVFQLRVYGQGRLFIPRPETERLVELALDFLPAASPARILEIAAARARSACRWRPRAAPVNVSACDISPAALEATRENAQNLGVEDRVEVSIRTCFRPWREV
jgi:hypothetical protein